jgi:hypothetical protein
MRQPRALSLSASVVPIFFVRLRVLRVFMAGPPQALVYGVSSKATCASALTRAGFGVA